jgi:hypothetical protein
MSTPPDSMGKMISRFLLPLGQQFAANSGFPAISKLLADEHIHGLVAQLGDSVLAGFAGAGAKPREPDHSQVADGAPGGTPAETVEMQQLASRLTCVEAQHAQLVTFIDAVRTQMRPLAQALGCCPECLVGVEGCPACWGKSTVGANPPDLELLQSRIVEPLAASGIPLRLDQSTPRLRVGSGRNSHRRETGANS